MKTQVYLFLIALCWSGTFTSLSKPNSLAQQKEMPYIQGIVVDFVSKSPIQGAKAVLEGTEREVLTNKKGEFVFDRITPGTYNIRVMHPTHKPLLLKNITIEKEQGRYFTFNLKSGNPDDEPLVGDNSPQSIKVLDEIAEPIRTIQPVYPATAIKDKVEGVVYLFMSVNKEGDVMAAWVSEGIREDLDRAALEAAKDYKFKPAKANGKFVGTTVTIPFKFKLVPKGSYPLKEVEGKLTTKDLEDALSFLGVGIARFTYELPFKHRLIVSAEQFVQGKQQGTHPVMQSTTIPKSGKRAFTLLIHKKDQQLSIGLNADGVLSTMSGILVKGYNVDGSTTLSDATLQEKIKTPFFIYVASKQGGIIVDSKANVEELISKYELAVVFYVELEPL